MIKNVSENREIENGSMAGHDASTCGTLMLLARVRMWGPWITGIIF